MSLSQKFRRMSVGLAAVSALAVLVAACGGGGSSGAASGSGDVAPAAPGTAASTWPATTMDVPDTLTLSLSGGFQASNSAAFAAVAGPLAQLGKKYGVEVKTINSESGAQAISALLGGSADICVCGTPRALAATASGERLVGVFSPNVGNGTVVIGPKKDQAALGTDVTKYQRATWAYASSGGVNFNAAQAVAASAGLDFASIKQLAFGDVSAAIPTLQSGRAQLMFVDPGSAANAVDLGVGYVVTNLLDPKVMAAVTGASYDTGIWFKPDFVAKYPALVQAVVTSLVESQIKLSKASSTEALALMTPAFQAANKDPKVWEQLWQFVQPSIAAADGGFRPDYVKSTLDGALKAKAIKSVTPELSAAFDDQYVAKAYQLLGVPRPTGS
jgi:ABC-type nitrate/sulfonate/bicarbonate transport system substrate-binding protein